MDVIFTELHRARELKKDIQALDAILDGILFDSPRTTVEVKAYLEDTGSDHYCVNVMKTPFDISWALSRTRLMLQEELAPILSVLERAEQELSGD